MIETLLEILRYADTPGIVMVGYMLWRLWEYVDRIDVRQQRILYKLLDIDEFEDASNGE